MRPAPIRPAVALLAGSVLWGAVVSGVGAEGAPVSRQDAVRNALSMADRNVDAAWEAFHRAALGGTLASPAVQGKIERALHDARRLLTEAREAAEAHDRRAVFDLTERVGAVTRHIQEDSRRRKP